MLNKSIQNFSSFVLIVFVLPILCHNVKTNEAADQGNVSSINKDYVHPTNASGNDAFRPISLGLPLAYITSNLAQNPNGDIGEVIQENLIDNINDLIALENNIYLDVYGKIKNIFKDIFSTSKQKAETETKDRTEE